jgi:hypothetical protein
MCITESDITMCRGNLQHQSSRDSPSPIRPLQVARALVCARVQSARFATGTVDLVIRQSLLLEGDWLT